MDRTAARRRWRVGDGRTGRRDRRSTSASSPARPARSSVTGQTTAVKQSSHGRSGGLASIVPMGRPSWPRGYQRAASRPTTRLPPTSRAAPKPGVPAGRGGERQVGAVHLEAQLEPLRRQRHLLHRPTGERPARVESAPQADVGLVGLLDQPAFVEHGAVHRVPSVVGGQLVHLATPSEPASARAAGERRHRVAAPQQRVGGLARLGLDEHLVTIDHERRQPTAACAVHAQRRRSGGQRGHLRTLVIRRRQARGAR